MNKLLNLSAGGANTGRAIVNASEYFTSLLKNARKRMIQQRIFRYSGHQHQALLGEIYGTGTEKRCF
jgi:hypothetical protein